MGKTYKDDVRNKDVKTHKKIARDTFKETDMRTRVKPIEKKEKGGGKNWRHEFNLVEEDPDDDELIKHLKNGTL